MWTYNETCYPDFMYHHGIRGQRWGRRRYQDMEGHYTAEGRERYGIGDGMPYHNLNYKPKDAPNYSTAQRSRDRALYGNGAVRRINKRMLNGEGVQGARRYEVERIEGARSRARVLGEAGKVAGTAAGLVGGMYLSQKVLRNVPGLSEIMESPVNRIVIGLATEDAAMKVGKLMGQYGGQSIGMLMGGYSPSKYQ